MKRWYFPLFALSFCFATVPETAFSQCLTWSSPAPPATYNSFNNFFPLGAPCDPGTGCPFNEIAVFEVFASEAYICNNFQAGGTYVFSICNGPGVGSWVPEFTIRAPSGAVDAFGPGDGDGCSITWTATENGTYTIIINEAGYCPGGPHNNTGNGYPALTCLGGTVCSGSVCASGELTTTIPVSACGAGTTFSISTDGTEVTPPDGGHGWYFNNELGGTGGIPGGFTLTNVPYSGSFNADLNGVLSQNSYPPLVGKWVIKSVTYVFATNPSNTVCGISADSLIVTFSPNGPLTVSVVDNGNGSATANATGGTSPYTYLWSNSQATQTATALPTGDYSVVVTDAYGCTGMASVSVLSGISDRQATDVFAILPNPTTGLVWVKITDRATENVVINVLDVTGKVVANSNGKVPNGPISLDLSGQPVGVYLVKLTIGSETFAHRLVLAR